MKKRLLFFVWVFLFLLPFLASPTYAQTEDKQLSLRLSRDFGYSSGRGDIQGTFSMKASGPEDLERVVFLIDEEIIAEINEPPFNLRFNTDNYPPGIHRMSAVGYTSSGQELISNEIQAEFVTAQQSQQQTVKFILPLLGFIVARIINISTHSNDNIPGKDYQPTARCSSQLQPFWRHDLLEMQATIRQAPLWLEFSTRKIRPLPVLREMELNPGSQPKPTGCCRGG